MRTDDDDISQQEGEGGEGEEGKGGKSGKIHFKYKDAASLPPRDDALPESEIKRLLVVHKDLQKAAIDKQKQTRKDRKAVKEGKLNQKAGYQMGGGGASPFKKHRIADTAQFSGMDRQTIGIPSEYDAETNLENREELENRNELQNELRHNLQYKSTPKLRPPGG